MNGSITINGRDIPAPCEGDESDGRLLMHLPYENMPLPHMPLTHLHSGTFQLGS